MPTKFSRRMAEKSVTITSRRLDRSFGIFFGRFISSFRISVIVRETKIGIVWLQAVSAREKEDFGNRSPFETTARTEPHRTRRALHSKQRTGSDRIKGEITIRQRNGP